MSQTVHQAIIGGKRVSVDRTVDVMNPSSGEVLAVTVDCGPYEIDLAVRDAAAAQRSWKKVAVAERARLLRRVASLIIRDWDELAEFECLQTGKPLSQARRDVELTARYFDFYASAVETFYGTAFPLDERTQVVTIFEPHGVTAHIIPWNYPLQILGRSLAPSLATGNCAVVKPAEEAPLTALKLAELVLEAGLPEGAVNVVPGLGETAGAALTAHPGVSHISFTGSVEVGRLIAHAAASLIIPATLELGGKSPNIVFADADLDRAAPIIANSILQCGGQTCSAGSRLLVEDAVHDELVSRLRDIFAGIEIGSSLDDPGLGPLISAQQRDRVLSYIDIGATEGQLVYGGNRLSGGKFGEGYFIEPAILDGISADSRVFQEEIFGPVLSVTSFDGVDEAVELANATNYALVAGVWTANINTAQRLVREVVSGQIFVNSYGASGGVELPFGGFKESGYGREKGAEGLRGFVQIKTSVVVS
jgi:aldehyde dehydrogenase (NAD+)/betaine-aldehyde dehydrogenase